MAVGGAAGAKGYLFQQRVSAAFLLVEILEKPLSLVLGERFDFRPRSYIFEGDVEIDDLCIRADEMSIYANIKTNLRFSLNEDGALRSAFDQFAKQHISGNGKEHFLLICDDKSSNQIRLLGELIDRMRLVSYANARSALLDDQDFRMFDQIVRLAKCSLGTEADRAAFDLLQKTSIVIFSFDFSGSFIHALKVLATSAGFARADRLWEKLTLDCFVFAKARQVLDADFLRRRYEEFRTEGMDTEYDFLSELRLEEDQIDWVKELIVAEWDPELESIGKFEPDGGAAATAARKIAILEMYRFDEDGKRRLEFQKETITLQSGLRLKVLGRFAGFSALERMIDAGRIDLSGADVRIFPANVDWLDKKDEPHVRLHANSARLAFDSRVPKDVCMECGKSLFATRIQLVEVDEIGRSYQCGPAHLDCVTPTSRVIGDVRMPAAEEYKALRSFDLNKWVKLAKLGPAGYAAIDSTSKNATLFWNWTHVIRGKGDYCTKMIGRDRSGQVEEQYVTERGNVVLRGREDQLQNVERLRKIVDEAKSIGNPMMFEVGGMFGPRSQFLRVDRDVGPIYEVTDFAIEKYSREKMATVSAKFQWYTPVCVVRTASGRLFEYKDAIVLMRDPFKLPRFLRQLEGHIPESLVSALWLDIVATDHEFDSMISACFNLELNVVLDPSVDIDGEYRQGIEVRPMPVRQGERNFLVESIEDI